MMLYHLKMLLLTLLLVPTNFALAKTVESSSYQWSQLTSGGVQKVELKGKEHARSSQIISFEDYEKSLKSNKVTKIVLLGDTGCRLKESIHKSSYQDCRDPKKWPYLKISEQIAKEKPDLIIHTGDYHYREKCTSEKCKKYSDSIGYGWDAWNEDFFIPSVPAFKVAPWLFVRGNHEDCDRAYLGYKSYISSQTWKSDCSDFEDSEVIKIGDLVLINLDSSGIADIPDPREDTAKLWKERFSEIEKKISKLEPTKYVWLLTHKPFYGFAPLGGGYGPVNVNLRKFFEQSSLFKKVQLIIGGHVHSSQVAYSTESPLQLVIGNSGSALDKFSTPISESNTQMLGYSKAKNITRDFGYAVIERKTPDSSWMISFRGVKGEIQYECGLNSREDCVK